MPTPWFDEERIGRRIQQARGSRSQRELGERLGYLQPHISRYERGEVPGSFRFLAGLSALLDVDVNWVLTGRGSRERARPDGGVSEARLEECVRRAVLAAIRDPGGREASFSSRPESPGVGTILAPELVDALPAWDRLWIELPSLALRLVSGAVTRDSGAEGGDGMDRAPSRDSGGASRPDEPTQTPGPVEPRAVLEGLRASAAAKDQERALGLLREAADALERDAASLTALERVRQLLLWAIPIAEARGADGHAGSAVPEILFRLARVTRKAGRLDEAEALYVAGRDRALASGDEAIAARCHAGLGHLYFERGEFEAARSEYVRVLEAALRLGSPDLLFFAYLDLATYYHEHERAFAKAAEYAAAGLEIARREGDRQHVCLFLNELGLNAMEMGDLSGARQRFDESLTLAEERGDVRALAIARINLGELRLRSGETDAAVSLLLAAREAATPVGLGWAECQAEILLARCDQVRGRTASALERLERVEDRASASGLKHELERARLLEREIRRGVLGRLEALTA